MIARPAGFMGSRGATLRRAAAPLLLPLLAILVIAAPAPATELKLRTCSQHAFDEASTAYGWYPQRGGPVGYFPMWTEVSDCPRGLWLDTSATAENGMWAQLTFNYLYRPVASASLTIEGETNSNIEYELVACEFDVCRTVRQIAQRASSDLPERVNVPLGTWPESIFALRATCKAVACGGSERLRIRDIEFEMVDVKPPTLSVGATGGSSSPENAWWHKPSEATVGVGGYDYGHSVGAGVGMGRVWATVDADPSKYFHEIRCSYSLEIVVIWSFDSTCVLSLSAEGDAIDLSRLSDGLHEVTGYSEDALGNRTGPNTTYFRTDGTPPDAPEDPVVQGLNQYGWTTDNAIRVTRWTNGAEVYRSATQSGIQGATYDFKPLSGQQPDPPPVSFGPGGPGLSNSGWMTIPSDGKWALSIRLSDGAGNIGDSMRIPVGRDLDAPDAPQLSANPWLSRVALIEGRSQSWTQVVAPTVEAGICGYAVSINTTASSDPVAVITHPGAVTSAPIPASTPAGNNYAHVRAVSCSGLASPTATTPIRVDETAPQIEVSGVPAAGWVREPITATLSASDSQSGVEGLEHRVDNGLKVSTPGSAAMVALGEGRHKLRYLARDNAGNVSAEQLRTIDVDSTPPSGAFLARDPQLPSQISARLLDRVSGIDTTQIQYRRIDVAGDDWHGLPTASAGDPADPAAQLLRAELPDDQLADGNYALRAAASDHAGNTAAIDGEETTGEPARIALPLRERWSVTAGLAGSAKSCKRAKRKSGRKTKAGNRRAGTCAKGKSVTVPDTKPTRLVTYGTRVSLLGSLHDSSGMPRGGVPLKIYSAVEGHAPELVGSVTTDGAGAFSFPVADGPSRRLTVLYEGSAFTLRASAAADLRVRAAASLSSNRRATRVGGEVVFSGRLLSGGMNIPRSGKLIQMQFLTPSGWQSGAATARADRNGRFRVPVSFTSPREKPVSIKFRALVLAEGAWPFVENASPVVTVTVKP